MLPVRLARISNCGKRLCLACPPVVIADTVIRSLQAGSEAPSLLVRFPVLGLLFFLSDPPFPASCRHLWLQLHPVQYLVEAATHLARCPVHHRHVFCLVPARVASMAHDAGTRARGSRFPRQVYVLLPTVSLSSISALTLPFRFSDHGNTKEDSLLVKFEFEEFKEGIAQDGTDKVWWDYRPLFRTKNARWRMAMVLLISHVLLPSPSPGLA